MTSSHACIQLSEAVRITYPRPLCSSDGLERIDLALNLEAMALLSDQPPSRLFVVRLVDLPADFPARGVAGAKVDVLGENDRHPVWRQVSQFRS